MRRDDKCRRRASGLPGGLKIESFVEASRGPCVVQGTEQAMHVIEFKNRSMIRFRVTVEVRSDSESLTFPPGEHGWTRPPIEVSGRPDRGGQFVRKVNNKLASGATKSDQGIIVSVKYEAIGPRCVDSTELMLLVDTRAQA